MILTVPGNERSEIDLNLPQKDVPPDGYHAHVEYIALTGYSTYTSGTDDPFRNSAPNLFPITISNLFEPAISNTGMILNDEQSTLLTCNNGVLIGDAATSTYTLYMTNRVAYGDIGRKVAGKDLQRRIGVEPVIKRGTDSLLTIALLFLPGMPISNPSNTDNDVSV